MRIGIFAASDRLASPCQLLARRGRDSGTEAAEEHIGQRAVHGLAHDAGQDDAAGADQSSRPR